MIDPAQNHPLVSVQDQVRSLLEPFFDTEVPDQLVENISGSLQDRLLHYINEYQQGLTTPETTTAHILAVITQHVPTFSEEKLHHLFTTHLPDHELPDHLAHVLQSIGQDLGQTTENTDRTTETDNSALGAEQPADTPTTASAAPLPAYTEPYQNLEDTDDHFLDSPHPAPSRLTSAGTVDSVAPQPAREQAPSAEQTASTDADSQPASSESTDTPPEQLQQPQPTTVAAPSGSAPASETSPTPTGAAPAAQATSPTVPTASGSMNDGIASHMAANSPVKSTQPTIEKPKLEGSIPAPAHSFKAKEDGVEAPSILPPQTPSESAAPSASIPTATTSNHTETAMSPPSPAPATQSATPGISVGTGSVQAPQATAVSPNPAITPNPSVAPNAPAAPGNPVNAPTPTVGAPAPSVGVPTQPAMSTPPQGQQMSPPAASTPASGVPAAPTTAPAAHPTVSTNPGTHPTQPKKEGFMDKLKHMVGK